MGSLDRERDFERGSGHEELLYGSGTRDDRQMEVLESPSAQ